MTDSFCNTLNMIFAGQISPALLSYEHWLNIHKVVEYFPSQLTQSFGFESRLAEKEPHADFSLCVFPEGRKILASPQSYALSELLLNHPIWQRLYRFCDEWTDTSSPLFEKLINIWLEFDIDGQSKSIPVPSVFFVLQDWEIRQGGTYEWVSQTALKLLLDKPLSPKIEQCLFHCFECLPQNAYIFAIAVMLARKSDAVRVGIRKLDLQEVLPYLKRIGWEGESDEFLSLIADLQGLASSVDLNIDVGDRVLPKIGFECIIDFGVETEAKIKQFLDYLVAKGLCLPEKRDGILVFPGYIHQRQNPEGWPFYLKWASAFLKPQSLSIFFKKLNHIKIVYQPHQPLEAKAYFGAYHNWLQLKKTGQPPELFNSEILTK